MTLTTSSFHLPQLPHSFQNHTSMISNSTGLKELEENAATFLLKKSWDAYEVGYDYRLELICNPIYPSNMFGHFYGLLQYNSIVLTKLRDPSCIDLGSRTPTTPSPWWARRLMLPLSAGNFSREGCMRNSPPLMPFGARVSAKVSHRQSPCTETSKIYRQAVDCRYTLGF